MYPSAEEKSLHKFLMVAATTLLIGGLFALLDFAKASRSDSASGSAKTRTIDAGTTEYAFRMFGVETHVPLVLLTRYRANLDDWDPAFLDALAQERRVIIFNQSGVASSPGSVPATIPAMAADVSKFLKATGCPRIDVLGWSMGGFTAQALAMDYPDLVRKVILVGTGPAASEQTPGPRDGVFDVAAKEARRDGTTTYSDTDRTYLFFSDAPISVALAAQSFGRIDGARRSNEPVTDNTVRNAQTAAIQAWWFDASNGYFNRLNAMPQPTLVINGDRDAFFTVGASDILYTEIPDASLAILPEAGHAPQHQYPIRVAEMIDSFLGDGVDIQVPEGACNALAELR